MLYYDRANISEGTDLAKSNSSQEFMICHYLFFIMGSNFKILYAMGCHDYTVISDIAIITVKNVDKCFIIHSINKSAAINSLENYMLENSGYI